MDRAQGAVTADGELTHGTRVGHFIVEGTLGAGGMGVVYAAHDRELDRRVALKVMRTGAATDEERARMLREGQAMARVTHPNVITVHEVGDDRGMIFLAEELLDGGTLGSWLEQPHPRDEILEKFALAGKGLAAAHAAGLVHRDFKPDNVLLGKDGRVRVADFGLARAEAELTTTRPNRGAAAPMSRELTATGAVMGTPLFMAPEQHLGERADARSDQFAFCVALYKALYGDWPYPGETSVALADSVIRGKRNRLPSGRSVPARLRELVLRGLATDPDQRFPSMSALLDELTRKPRRRGLAAAIALGVVAIAGGAVGAGYALRSHDTPATRPPPPPAFDPKALGGERGVAWLETALARGQLDDAIEKYAMAGSLAQQSGADVQASIAASAQALLDVERGHLDAARQQLATATAHRGSDASAAAYTDLAASAIAMATGDLDGARAHGDACAAAFAKPAPSLAAMCFERSGRAAAERGDIAAARTAYAGGLALAPDDPLLELGEAALDLDEDKLDSALANATRIARTLAPDLAPGSATGSAAASDDDATGDAGVPDMPAVRTRALVFLARVETATGSTAAAHDLLDHVKADALEPIALRLGVPIVHGEATVLAGDPRGFAEIDRARADAEAAGYVDLVFAARLAHVEAAILSGAPDDALKQALVADARKHGFERIAREVETMTQR